MITDEDSSENQLRHGIALQILHSCLSRLCGQRISHWLEKRDDYSLYLFSPTNRSVNQRRSFLDRSTKIFSFRLRRGLKWLILQKSFDYSVLFFIALNCITLAMERPSIPPMSFVRCFSSPRFQTICVSSLPFEGTGISQLDQLHFYGHLCGGNDNENCRRRFHLRSSYVSP